MRVLMTVVVIGYLLVAVPVGPRDTAPSTVIG